MRYLCRPMDGADAAGRLILELVSAAGRPIPLSALWNIPGLGGSSTSTAVGALEADGALQVDAAGLATVRHDVETEILAGLGTLVLADRRGALGRALRENTLVPPTVAAELMAAGLLAGPDPTVVPWIVEQARRRTRSGDLETAADLLTVARQTIAAGQPVPPPLRLNVLVRLAYVLRWLGRIDEADDLLGSVADEARLGSDPIALAIAAVAWSPRTIAISDDPSAVALIDQAIAVLPASEILLRSRVLCARANALVFTDLAAAQTAATASLELARQVDDPETFLQAAYAYRVAYWHPSRQDEMLALGTEMVSWGTRAADFAEFGPLVRLQVFLELGDFAHFDGEVAAMGRRLERHPRPLESLWYLALRSARALVRGEWDTVTALTGEALAVGNGPEYEVSYQLLVSQQLIAAWHRGEDLTGLTELPVPAGPLGRSWQANLLAWTCTRRPVEAVRAALDDHLAGGVAGVRHDLTFGPVTSALSFAAAEIASVPHAAILFEALRPYRHQWVGTGGAVTIGPFAYYLARLAGVLGQPDTATELLDEAERSATTADAFPWLARIGLARAELTGDPKVAAAAAGLAHRLQMTEVAARAGALATPAANPAGLSDREVEVLVLLAAGATNKAIAEALFLSVKTVERHLLNAYRKIGARGRAEATAFALRHHLGEG